MPLRYSVWPLHLGMLWALLGLPGPPCLNHARLLDAPTPSLPYNVRSSQRGVRDVGLVHKPKAQRVEDWLDPFAAAGAKECTKCAQCH